MTTENKINFMIKKNVYKDELTFELSKILSDQKIETKSKKIKSFGILITTKNACW